MYLVCSMTVGPGLCDVALCEILRQAFANVNVSPNKQCFSLVGDDGRNPTVCASNYGTIPSFSYKGGRVKRRKYASLDKGYMFLLHG